MPQLLVAFGVLLISFSLSSRDTARAPPSSEPSTTTTWLRLSSSASSSASPQLQFLHAFFLRGAVDAVTGSHGRALSESVRSASASIGGVPGVLSVHSAFFASGFVFLRRGSRSGAFVESAFLRETVAVGACAGFWAMRVVAEVAERIVKPLRVTSEGTLDSGEILCRCNVPSGISDESS